MEKVPGIGRGYSPNTSPKVSNVYTEVIYSLKLIEHFFTQSGNVADFNNNNCTSGGGEYLQWNRALSG